MAGSGWQEAKVKGRRDGNRQKGFACKKGKHEACMHAPAPRRSFFATVTLAQVTCKAATPFFGGSRKGAFGSITTTIPANHSNSNTFSMEPTKFERAKVGAMMGGAVGLCIGLVFGGISAMR